MSNFEKMQARLAAGETVLMDGGMGSEFDRRGMTTPTTWSGGPMLTHPGLVRDIHQEHIESGAEIIITNTYSTIPSYLGKIGMAERWLELTELAGSLARSAVEGAPGEARVAGSLPPLSESYRPDLVPPDAEALDKVADLAPDALLFNCTSPEAIAGGLAQLADLTDKPRGAYPNRFNVPEGWTLDGDAQTELRELSVEAFVNHALQWRELGASLIGGCCGIGPEHIAAAADRLQSS